MINFILEEVNIVRIKILMVILTIFFSSNLFADTTPKEFLATCNKKDNKVDQIVCMYYFIGYADGIIAGSYINSLPDNFVTSPLSINDTFTQYMDKNPEKSNGRLGKVILESLVAKNIVKLRE